MKELYDRMRARLEASLQWHQGMLQVQASHRDPKAFSSAAYVELTEEFLKTLDDEFHKLRKE